MQSLARFSLANRALMALVTIFVLAFGLLSTGALKQELIPSLQLPVAAVITTYAGASPAVVDEQISRPLRRLPGDPAGRVVRPVERGAGARAERLIGGLFSSTVLTLVLVPVLYTLVERARGWRGRRHGGRRHAGQHAAA